MQFLTSLIEQYGLFAVFLNLLLEGLGFPIPSYPILMIAAALAPQMHYSFGAIIAVAAAGSLLADSVWFWGGRQYGARIVKLLCKISLSPDSCVQNTNMMFVRIGAPSLSFAKFIPGFSTVSIVLASAMRIPALSVAFFDVIGVTLYAWGGVILGVLFHNAIADALAVLAEFGRGGLMVVVAAFGLYLFGKWVQRKRFMRELRMNRITVDELHTLIDDGLEPIILDVRPQQLRISEGILPGSIIVQESNLKDIADRFPSHSEVVVYCNCPNEASAVLMAKKLQKAGFKKIRPLLGGITAWAEAGHSVETDCAVKTGPESLAA